MSPSLVIKVKFTPNVSINEKLLCPLLLLRKICKILAKIPKNANEFHDDKNTQTFVSFGRFFMVGVHTFVIPTHE